MKLIKTLKITAILLIAHFSTAYGQGNITTHVIGNDTVFVMDRDYAEFVAERFDSLRAIKLAFNQCDTVIQGLQSVMRHRAEIINAQTHAIDGLRDEIRIQNGLIKSYERTQVVTDEIRAQLKKETRRRKVWRVVGCLGVGAGVVGVVWGIVK